MMRRSNLVFGTLLLAFVFLLALVGTFWTPYDPVTVTGSIREMPSAAHWLGTDGGGFDIASRLVAGAKLVLLVGLGSVAGAALIGIPAGMIAGMSRGWGASLIARGADVLYGFPALLLAILFAAALGGSVWTALMAIALSAIPAFVRIARAATIQVMGLAFVEAARLSGTPRRQIALRHVLPNIAPVLGVQASVSVGIAILAESGLSYLGLGSGTDVPTWGRMLQEAQKEIFVAPVIALWPGLAIAAATMGCNLLGDGLRDLLDPKLRELT